MPGNAESREWGTNLARVKDYNEVVVLDLVRSGGPIGRPAIAEATGLTLQTVSNIARRLLAADAVVEEPVSGGGDGRARRALRVNPDAGYAVGIQLVRDALAVGVVDLAGTVRARTGTPLAPGEAPDQVIHRLADLVEGAVSAAGVPRDRVLGAGIGAPGPLDLRRGVLLNVISPASWSHYPLRDAAADALGMRVIMDNDATAAALGERWRGAGAGAETFIYLFLGTGPGVGLVFGGQAYRGLRGNAGEVSHIEVVPGGVPCECGRRGCLVRYVSPDALLREARRVALETPASAGLPPAPETIEALLASSHPAYAAVLERAGEHLGRVLADMARVLDPELVVLGGPLAGQVGEAFRAPIARALADLDEPGAPAPRVELSRIEGHAGVVGAATLVLHHLYAPSAHKLSLADLAAAEARA
jgi:predicted NBD/HSP70 family sugar kinase